MNINQDEYPGYYAAYVKLSNNKPLMDQLKNHSGKVLSVMDILSEDEALYRYDSGKWSVKEIFGHLTDTEIIFSYRALAIARGEKTSLPGFNQDQYAATAHFDNQPLEQLKKRYLASRESTLALFSGFDEKVMLQKGMINNGFFTVRALGYIIAGHEIHHLNILRERYLK